MTTGFVRRPVTTPIQTVLVLCTPPEWTKQAGCLDQRDLFDLAFNSRKRGVVERARLACFTCPVVDECLAQAMTAEHGLTARHRYGVCGGKTPRERAAMAPV